MKRHDRDRRVAKGEKSGFLFVGPGTDFGCAIQVNGDAALNLNKINMFERGLAGAHGHRSVGGSSLGVDCF